MTRFHNVERRVTGPVIFAELVRDVAGRHQVSATGIVGPSQERKFVRARAEVADALHSYGWSSTQIGRVLHRHHTSVLHLFEIARAETKRRAKLALLAESGEIPVPDLSGEWAI